VNGSVPHPVTGPRVSVVIPARDEDEGIVAALQRIAEGVTMPHEVLVVVDHAGDTTVAAVERVRGRFPHVRVVVQDLGRGPASAIRAGFAAAAAPTVVVTMADGSDDAHLIEGLVRLVERGCVIAAASRYMPGGAQIDGPLLKRILSRAAGVSLHLLAGVGTRDATNSFKAYSAEFVRRVGIDSRGGFEIAIELVAKARRLRRPIGELPSIWIDRHVGSSNFQLRRWLPGYLRWYRFAYGRRLTEERLRERTARMAARTARRSAG
jgi:dolichol-phosphate mannosyltransferase